MAKAQKWTVAKLLQVAKTHKVSLTALATAIQKAISGSAPAALPAPSGSGKKAKRTSSARSRHGVFLAAVRKAYADYKAANGGKLPKAAKEKIVASLQHLKVKGSAPKTPKIPKTSTKPAPKPASGGKRTSSARSRHGVFLAAVRKAYAAYKKANGGKLPESAKAKIVAKYQHLKVKGSAPKTSKVKPPKTSTKPAPKPASGGKRTSSAKHRHGLFLAAVRKSYEEYKAAHGGKLSESAKAKIVASLQHLKVKGSAPKTSKVKPPKTSTKPAPKPATGGKRTSSAMKRQGKFLGTLRALQGAYKKAHGKAPSGKANEDLKAQARKVAGI